jgi:hypothetical protein
VLAARRSGAVRYGQSPGHIGWCCIRPRVVSSCGWGRRGAAAKPTVVADAVPPASDAVGGVDAGGSAWIMDRPRRHPDAQSPEDPSRTAAVVTRRRSAHRRSRMPPRLPRSTRNVAVVHIRGGRAAEGPRQGDDPQSTPWSSVIPRVVDCGPRVEGSTGCSRRGSTGVCRVGAVSPCEAEVEALGAEPRSVGGASRPPFAICGPGTPATPRLRRTHPSPRC